MSFLATCILTPHLKFNFIWETWHNWFEKKYEIFPIHKAIKKVLSYLPNEIWTIKNKLHLKQPFPSDQFSLDYKFEDGRGYIDCEYL